MTGLIDVGGGMKCSYSAGLYDYFMDNGIEFDYCLGVSAGSMNLLSYLAGERGRNLQLYRASACGDDYLSISNLIRDGAYMNYEKVSADFFGEDGENAFDYDSFYKNDKSFVVSAVDAETGETRYFDKSVMTNRDDIVRIISASCCIPVASKPIEFTGKKFFDGGISEPVPFRKAFEDGCDKIIVVLSSPAEKKREKIPGTNVLGPTLLKDYPQIYEAVEDRHIIYNYMLRCLRVYEHYGKALVLSPEEIQGSATLAKDTEIVDKLYENGYSDGERFRKEINRMLEK